MFKKLASDVMGLSDIGTIISPSDYGSVDSDDYVMHEDGEKIYFLIKSKSDEYCFTNLGLIHLDGASAMDKKRMLKRYAYKSNPITNVRLETAGNIDLDVEIKFGLGSLNYSIDVDKKQIEQLKDLYKALVKISSIQESNEQLLDIANESIQITSEVLGGNKTAPVSDDFEKISNYIFNWKTKAVSEYVRADYGTVFEKYINN